MMIAFVSLCLTHTNSFLYRPLEEDVAKLLSPRASTRRQDSTLVLYS